MSLISVSCVEVFPYYFLKMSPNNKVFLALVSIYCFLHQIEGQNCYGYCFNMCALHNLNGIVLCSCEMRKCRGQEITGTKTLIQKDLNATIYLALDVVINFQILFFFQLQSNIVQTLSHIGRETFFYLLIWYWAILKLWGNELPMIPHKSRKWVPKRPFLTWYES